MVIGHTFKTISSLVIVVGEGTTFLLLFSLLMGGHLRTVQFDVRKKKIMSRKASSFEGSRLKF